MGTKLVAVHVEAKADRMRQAYASLLQLDAEDRKAVRLAVEAKDYTPVLRRLAAYELALAAQERSKG